MYDITAEQFLRWAEENPEDFKQLYEDEIRDLIYMLEQDDYFGTEGFAKRLA